MLLFITLLIIGISLSMDTFSLSIIYGTIGFDKNKIRQLSIIVGIYHFFMPLFGNKLGVFINNRISIDMSILVGIIFIIISLQMFFQKDDIIDLKRFYSLLLFGLTVSIDSFSVGIGLSAITNNVLLASIIFAIVSLVFTYVGLTFGKVLSNRFGKNATKLGAFILILLGFYYIFV